MKKSQPKKRGASGKQKKLIEQLPLIVTGKRTKADSMRRAGYKESSVNQHSMVFGSLRVNSAMQEALRKVGVTEDRIADKIEAGMNGKECFVFTKLAAELLDAFPAKKQINTDVSIADLIKAQEGSTPKE